MKVLVFELNSFHMELLPMYQPLLPSLFDNRQLDLQYFVLPSLVERAREVVGEQVFPLNPPRLRYVLPAKRLRAAYYLRRIQKLVDRLDPVAIVFNTVEPPAYLRVFRQIRHPIKIGIVHNPRRAGIDYERRGSGELIFCLHDYNYRLLEKDTPVDGYLSPFFRCRDLPAATAPKDRLEIAVQGVVSFGRRDYPMLVTLWPAAGTAVTDSDCAVQYPARCRHSRRPQAQATRREPWPRRLLPAAFRGCPIATSSSSSCEPTTSCRW